MRHVLLLATCLLSCVPAARASEQVGTLTRIEGEVQLFTHPSKSLPAQSKEGERALFEGEYYVVTAAKPGVRVEHGNILRTAVGAKARVIYDNGDTLQIGPGTAYRIFWDNDTIDAKTELHLLYGKLRGIVEKGGPRSKLTIRTKAVTIGVRGTDFFIAEDAKSGETEVSVLRGAVEVKPISAEASAPALTLPVGESTSAEIAASSKLAPRRTTQEELRGIQGTSEMKKASASANLAPLEKKAAETALKDAMLYTPKLVANLKAEKVKDVAQINSLTVTALLKKAPKAAPHRKKKYLTEPDDLESDAYDKYFKPFD